MDDSFELITQDGLTCLRGRLLTKYDFVDHAFMTGKCAAAGCGSLDLSRDYDEKGASANGSWERLARRFSLQPADFVTLRQVHQDRIWVLAAAEAGPERGSFRAATLAGSEEGRDAVITDRPGLALAIRTADCVPLLLADPVKRVAGAVHAGWRGAALDLPAKTVDTFRVRFGSNPADMIALLGPAIGPCCYQVDRIVFDALRGEGSNGQFFLPQTAGKWQLDLRRLIAAGLMARGLRQENIESSALCTSCRRDLFFSHRASGGESGRQLSFIRIAKGRIAKGQSFILRFP